MNVRVGRDVVDTHTPISATFTVLVTRHDLFMRLTDMQVADCVECCVYDRVKVSDPFLALFLGEEQRHLVEGVEDGRCVDEVCALLPHRVCVLHVVQQTSVHVRTLRSRESSTLVECDLVIMIFAKEKSKKRV